MFKKIVYLILAASCGFASGAVVSDYQSTAFWKMDGTVPFSASRAAVASEIDSSHKLALGATDVAAKPVLTTGGGGFSGEALSFAGNSAAYCSTFRINNPNVALEFYFKTDDVTTTQTLVMAANAIEIRINAGEIIFYYYYSSSQLSSVRTAITASAWHHVRAVSHNGTISFTVDGTTVTATSALNASNNMVYVGSASNLTRFYNGLIDELQFRNPDTQMPSPPVITANNQTEALWFMDEVIPFSASRNAVVSTVGGAKLALGATDISPLPVLTTNSGGFYGEALSFTGTQGAYSNDYRPNRENLGMEFFFKTDDVTTAQTLFMIANTFEVRIGAGELVFYTLTSAGGVASSVRTNITPYIWHYANISAADGIISLSVDGGTAVTATGSLLPNNNRLTVGARFDFGARFYTGLIDELHFMNLDIPTHNWQQPYQDRYDLNGLWHFDMVKTGSDAREYVLDTDPNNGLRAYNNLYLNSPVMVTPATYPNDDPAFGNCLSFTRTNSDIAKAEAFNRDLSVDPDNLRVECWFKTGYDTPTGSNTRYTLVQQRFRFKLLVRDLNDGTKNLWRLEWRVNDNGASTTETFVLDYAGIDGSKWHHVAGEILEGTVKLYVDGVLVGSKPFAGTGVLRQESEQFAVGGPEDPFFGLIDEVRVSNAVPSEVSCGAMGYPPADINKDCYVDLLDLAMLAGSWMEMN